MSQTVSLGTNTSTMYLHLCVIILIHIVSENSIDAQDFFKTHLSPFLFTSVLYLDGEVHVYEYLQNRSHFYVPPVPHLTLNQTRLLYNRFNNRHLLRLSLTLFSKELQAIIAKHLSTKYNRCGTEQEVCEIRMIPTERLRIVWKRKTKLSSNYELDTTWQSNSALLYQIDVDIECTTSQACQQLVTDLQSDPHLLNGLTLEYSTQLEQPSRKAITLIGDHLMKTDTYSKLKQMTPLLSENSSIRYLLIEDVNQLVNEAMTIMESKDMIDIDYARQNDRKALVELLRERLSNDSEILHDHTSDQWEHVFWNFERMRPDRLVEMLNDKLFNQTNYSKEAWHSTLADDDQSLPFTGNRLHNLLIQMKIEDNLQYNDELLQTTFDFDTHLGQFIVKPVFAYKLDLASFEEKSRLVHTSILVSHIDIVHPVPIRIPSSFTDTAIGWLAVIDSSEIMFESKLEEVNTTLMTTKFAVSHLNTSLVSVENYVEELKTHIIHQLEELKSLVTIDNRTGATLKPKSPTRILDLPSNTVWSDQGITIIGRGEQEKKLDQLNHPEGLCVDEDGTVFIADSYNHRIVQWNRNDHKTIHVVVGKKQLNRPTDVSIDKENRALIICDHGNRRVMRWSLRGDPARGQIIINDVSCWGLAMDSQRDLYVTDVGRHELRRYRIEKNTLQYKFMPGSRKVEGRVDQLKDPRYVFVDKDDAVYVSDSGNHRVVKWEKEATNGTVVAGYEGQGSSLRQLSVPEGIFVDAKGTVYVAEYGNHRVTRWHKGMEQGEIIAGQSGIEGKDATRFNGPLGLSFDRHGRLYVTDWNNHRVQRFDLEKDYLVDPVPT